MSDDPTEKRSYFFRQNFAFSTNYLDYEIPDFRGYLARTVPIVVMPHGAILDVKLQPLSAKLLDELIRGTLADDNVLVCNNAVQFHQFALRQAGDNKEYRDTIWRLTDQHALWDVCLLERRIVWGIEGRVIDLPEFGNLLEQYDVPKVTLPPEGLQKILIAQFDRLIANLPFLTNDVVGRRIFREHEYDSPYIPAPTRVLARDKIHFKERLHVFLPLIEGWKQYGPACIGIDVQGAIAVHYIDQQNRQMPPDSQRRFNAELSRLRNMLQNSSDKRNYTDLKHDRAESDGSPAYTKSARNSVLHHWDKAFGDHRDLKELLESAKSSTPDHILDELLKFVTGEDEGLLSPLRKREKKNKQEIEIPCNYHYRQRNRRFPLSETGTLSLNPDHWGQSIPPGGPLRIWADYHAALKAVCSGNRFSHICFPYLTSGVAELAVQKEIPLLSAPESSGRVLLKFRIRDIDLLSYLRTHLETDFVCEDGSGEPLANFRDAGNCPEETPTRTEWYRNDLSESLVFPELADGERIGHRVLSCDLYPRDYWEMSPYFATYRFFERSPFKRDIFLAEITAWYYSKIDKQYKQPLLDLPPDRLLEHLLVLTRFAVKGLLRGKMTVEQVRSIYDDIVPKNIDRDLFSHHVEMIQKGFLYFGRFRAMLRFSVFNTIFSRLCIDPVYCNDYMKECLRLDGEWREFDRLRYYDIHPILRNDVNDIMHFNQLVGGQDDSRCFDYLLQPLIEERCRMLGLDSIKPSRNLLDRLTLTNAISRNGKPGRPVYEFEIPFTSWIETLDDLKKSIAYSIVRHCVDSGDTLMAISNASYIVDADRKMSETIKMRISSVIRRTAEHSLGLEADEFGNFIDSGAFPVWPFVVRDREVRS